MFALVLGSATACFAEDASPWSGDHRSTARLLAGERRSGGDPILSAGIEIKLAPGWKTYWRYAGDSGVPPRLDFAKSENLRSVEVLWPAPRRFSDDGESSIGYETEVILPLRVVPQNPAMPVILHLKLDYAICEKLCVLADATAELRLSGQASAYDAALTAARAHVPKPGTIGDAGPLAIHALQREGGLPHPRVTVDVAAAATSAVDLFAEGPTPDWALPVPQPVPGAPPGVHRFAFDLEGLPPGADPKGAVLKLTAVSGEQAIEVLARLD